MQVITRLDSIMYGLLGAYAYIHHKKIFLDHKRVFFISGLSILFISKYFIGFTTYEFYNNVFSFMLESIGTLLLIPLLVSIKKGKGFFYKMITFISIISYSMYLLNDGVIQGLVMPGAFKIFGIVDSKTTVFLLTKYFLYWFCTLTISYFLYILWERPMNSYRDKIVFNKIPGKKK
jgi:peptidoglycan/LPS O-acetylase OafA/YrhL